MLHVMTWRFSVVCRVPCVKMIGATSSESFLILMHSRRCCNRTTGSPIALLSGSALVSINEVILRRARLALGWVMGETSVCNQPPRPTQPSTLSGTENEYRAKCGDAWQVWFIPLVDKRVGGR